MMAEKSPQAKIIEFMERKAERLKEYFPEFGEKYYR